MRDVPELGFVAVRDGVVTEAVRPEDNLFSSRLDRWTPTLRYLREYAAHHPDFGGEFLMCLYDGFREYAEPPSLDPLGRGRKRVPWSALPASDRALFLGRGRIQEPRFRPHHPDASLYPDMPRPVLAYNRHIADGNVRLLPDAEFLENGFAGFASDVRAGDVPWESKRDVFTWRGTRNVTDRNASWHPRDVAVDASTRLGPAILDASFDRTSVADMLRSKYLLSIDGMVSPWSGLYWKLLSGSVVVQPPSHWEHWYSDRMEPYVPIANFQPTVVRALHDWCRYNDAACKGIADAGRALAESITYTHAVEDYVI